MNPESSNVTKSHQVDTNEKIGTCMFRPKWGWKSRTLELAVISILHYYSIQRSLTVEQIKYVDLKKE